MKYRPRWGVLAIGAIVVAMLFTFPFWWRLTGGKSAAPGPFALANDDQMGALAKDFRDRAKRESAYWAMLTTVPVPTDTQPTLDASTSPVLSGDFAVLDALRTAAGRASIYRLRDDTLVLRLEGFSVTNAPSLTVYLCDNPTPTILKGDKADCSYQYFTVGPLKGTVGDQQYPLPVQKDLQVYHSVVIYSDGLDTIYTYATLK
ncbi:MAG TPA: DM13 domain-containing protein [Aggregatilineales bacterium]|nr:DM13 domain-containing protein [Aggregatilineales bacterium]